MKKRKLLKKEGGQSLVEFALVLPLFMLILMGIIDFGWFFYNYIGVENAARNAARIACVEYQNTNLNYGDDNKITPKTEETYYFSPEVYETYKNDTHLNENKWDAENNPYTVNQTIDILDAAKAGIPSSITLQSLNISYGYDVKSVTDNSIVWSINNRSKGDVKITLNAKIHALTPVLGVFGDNMEINLKSTSTYKVERAPIDND